MPVYVGLPHRGQSPGQLSWPQANSIVWAPSHTVDMADQRHGGHLVVHAGLDMSCERRHGTSCQGEAPFATTTTCAQGGPLGLNGHFCMSVQACR
eukprot:1151749-Pelagomonas_calceolata.AAC.1